MRPRLHLGCGRVHRPGWLNIDRYPSAAADVRADVLLLPIADRAVEAIDARQLLEHLGRVGALYALHEWARVLAPGGALHIETPDRPAVLAAAGDGASADVVQPWLWGGEQHGHGHRYLFAAAELAELVESAGFAGVTVEQVARQPARPSLRLTARRAEDTPATQFTMRMRRALLTAGLLDPANAPPWLAVLEDVLAQATPLAERPGSASLLQLVSTTARFSPRLAACALAALPDPSAWPAGELAQARQLVDELRQASFPARLACRWRTLPKLPGATAAAWARVEREASLYLAARLCPNEGLDDVIAAWDAVTATPTASDRAVFLFCRPALCDLARELTAAAVRAWSHGHLLDAENCLLAALDYEPDLAWARWNLARLTQRQGHQLDALAHYAVLLGELPAALQAAYERELDAVTGRAGDALSYAVPLADPAELLEDAP